MKIIDITKGKARVLVVTLIGTGFEYEPVADYANHNVFDYAPDWATEFPTFVKNGYIKQGDELTSLGADIDSHKVAYYWAANKEG